MLEMDIPERELFNEKTMEFIKIKKTKLQLEHSLVSLKKWESKWHKPFLNLTMAYQDGKTEEEILDYIRCMSINKVDSNVFLALNEKEINTIVEYIKNPMTATWFNEKKRMPGSGYVSSKAITNEIIYYWMIALNVPMECQKWHLNQLLTLIKVVNLENQPKKKMGQREAAQMRAAQNAARRKKYNTKG